MTDAPLYNPDFERKAIMIATHLIRENGRMDLMELRL